MKLLVAVAAPAASCSSSSAPRRRAGGSSGTSSRPPGALGDVGERLDDPLAERRARPTPPTSRRCRPCGEAQPFLAIIVAMLEEMLGEHDPKPGAQPADGSRMIAASVIAKTRPIWPIRTQSPPTISSARVADIIRIR
jgi:hypothetical protein